MSFKKRVIPALVASAMLIGAPSAQAVQFSGVFVFGDSLSDAGYFRPFLSAIGLPAATVAGMGRFTTNPGPVWSELIATYYGGNPNPSNAGGGIYAQGGARIAADSTSTPPVAASQRPVSTQITEYFASHGGAADPNALYAVWGGANDVLQLGAAGIQPAAVAEIGQVGRLAAAGARYILVFGQADFGKTPGSILQGPAAVAGGQAAAIGYNTVLFTGLKSAGLKVIPVDTFTLLNDVLANASAFGFTNTTGVACGPFPGVSSTQPPNLPSAQFCNGSNLVAANAATTYVFADYTGHSTTATNAIVADFVKSLIDGPNAYSTLAEVPLSSRASHVRTLDEGLRSGNMAEVGKVVAFAAGDGGKSDISANPLSPQSNTKNRGGSVGVTMRASDVLTVGLAAGKSSADTSLGAAGKFNLDETAISLFASLKSGGFYGSFMGTASDLKYKNVQRFVKLGIVNRVASSSTKGSNNSSTIAAGYDFGLGTLSVGPFASIAMQSVSVAEFSESGSGAADLNIFSQSRTSRVVSAGVRASADLGNWTPYARVSIDKELNDENRFVSANPVSVAAGLSYDIPAYKPDATWVTGTIGIRGKITNNIGVSVAYSAVSSKQNVKQDGVSAAVAFGF
jgi:outer membrane lipase/esterase